MSARTDAFIAAVKEEWLAVPEMNPELNRATGATAHMLAAAHRTGKLFVLTGHDIRGRRFTREAHSFLACYALLTSLWGLERAWQVLEPAGKRRLVFERAAAQ